MLISSASRSLPHRSVAHPQLWRPGCGRRAAGAGACAAHRAHRRRFPIAGVESSASSRSLRRWWARGCCWSRSTGANSCATRSGYSASPRSISPVLAAAGVLMGAVAALVYMRRQRMPLGGHARRTRRAAGRLAWPSSSSVRCWPARATAPRPRSAGRSSTPIRSRSAGAARRSAFPCIRCRLMPRSAYLTLAVLLLVWLPRAPAAGRCCRNGADGRRASSSTSPNSGAIRKAAARCLHGALDGPQLAAIVFVLAGRVVAARSRTAGAPVARTSAGWARLRPSASADEAAHE